jgi:hypothetical protein
MALWHSKAILLLASKTQHYWLRANGLPFLRNRQQVDGFSGGERPLEVVEVPADRFAREILAILMPACAARSRQLNGNPLDGTPSHQSPATPG